VWWDRTIPPGRQFDEVIEEELAAAGSVVVLWSKASVASSWVKTEAAEAMERKILVPALIEDVKIPLEFRRLQAADLSHWHAGEPDPQLDEFFAAVADQLRRRGHPAADVRPDTTGNVRTEARRDTPFSLERPQRRRPSARAALAAMVAVVVAVVLVVAYVARDGREPSRPAARDYREYVPQKNATPPERDYRERRPQRTSQTVVPSARVAAATEPVEAGARRPASETARAQADRPQPQADLPRSQADPPRAQPEPVRQVADARPRPAAASAPDISGMWRDTTWGNMSEISQKGDAFQFTAWGSACRGNFRSSGSGTIRAQRFESAYRSSMPSEGRCTGTVSPDGTRVWSTCFDSVCGAFTSAAVRQ
jgi:TIR domain